MDSLMTEDYQELDFKFHLNIIIALFKKILLAQLLF